MNAQLKTRSTTAYELPYFSPDTLGPAVEEPMFEAHASLQIRGIRAAGRPPTGYRRSGYAALVSDWPAVRDAWGEFHDGLHRLPAGNLLMLGSTTTARNLIVSQQREQGVQESARDLAAAWSELVRKDRSVPAFEQEIEVHVRVAPRRTVLVTAIVIGRNRAEPNPILDR